MPTPATIADLRPELKCRVPDEIAQVSLKSVIGVIRQLPAANRLSTLLHLVTLLKCNLQVSRRLYEVRIRQLM